MIYGRLRQEAVMRRVLFIGCMIAAAGAVLSCKNLLGDATLPESVSVETDATYKASLGNVTDALSNYISASILQNSIGTSASVYDYNPDSSASVQEYMVEYPLATYQLDFGSMVNSAISTQLQSFEKSYTMNVPAVNQSSSTTVSVGADLTDKIGTPAPASSSIIIPESSSETSLSGISTDVTIGVGSASYSSGNLVVTLTPSGSAAGTKNISLSLYNSSGSLITSGTGTGTGTDIITVTMPLSGATLTSLMKLAVGGTVSGGTTGTLDTYTAAFSFSAAVLSKVSGVSTTINGISVPSFTVSAANSQITTATISSGSLILRSALPSGWSGLTMTFASNPSVSGALTGTFSDGSADGYLVYKTLDLAGRTYTPGDASVSGTTANLTLNDATVVFDSSGNAALPVEGICSITGVSSAEVLVSSLGSLPSLSFSETLSELSGGAVSSITNPSVTLGGTALNGLPSGNDIKLTTTVTIHTTDGSETNTISGGNTSAQTLTDTTATAASLGSSEYVKASAVVLLPGQSDSTDTTATFTNITLGTDYSFSSSVSLTMGYNTVTVDTTNMSSELSTGKTVSANIDFSKIFSGLSSSIDTSKFTLKTVPAYLYITAPSAVKSLFGNPNATLSYAGTTQSGSSVNTVLLSEVVKILTSDIDFGSTAATYTGKLSKDTCSVYTEAFTAVINARTNISSITYAMPISGSSVTISKNDMAAASSVSIKAVIVLPLDLIIASGGMSVDVASMAKVYDTDTSDLLHRKSDFKASDITKYTDAIEYFRINYTLNNPLSMSGAINLAVNDTYSGVNIPMSTTEKSVDLSASQISSILNSSIYHPSMVVTVPEGEVTIPRDCTFGISGTITVKTDGTVKIWEK